MVKKKANNSKKRASPIKKMKNKSKKITKKVSPSTKRKITRIAKTGIGAALERAAQELRKSENKRR